MSALPSMICKALLERSPVDEQSALLALFPADQRKFLETLPSATLGTKKGKDSLDAIHYSWMAPFLRTLAAQDLRLFLAALSKEQVEGLRELLGFSGSLLPLTSFAKAFIRRALLTHLTKGEELIPLEMIPVSALRPLVDLDHKKLMKLMRYLGLYDLAFEMKQIIATAQIKKILQCLKKEERNFLESLAGEHELLVFQRLFLQGWDETRKALVSLLEERGMQRVAIALYGQDKSLIWSLSHALDLPSATQLLKWCRAPQEMRISSILTQQILNLYEKNIL